MYALLFLLATSGSAPRTVVVDRVELNCYFNWDKDKLEYTEVFKQWIFWEWSPSLKEFVARDWQLVKDGSGRPRRVGGWYYLPLVSHQGKGLVVVKFKIYEVSYLSYDREMLNREILPVAQRDPIWRQ